MAAVTLTAGEEAQLAQTIEMFEVIAQSQPNDYQTLEILKEAYAKLGRESDVVDVSKRIAQAYVAMGQFSSAILEYESILQRHPDDAESLAALGEIESKANSLSSAAASATHDPTLGATTLIEKPKATKAQSIPAEVDDGRKANTKLFVESKLITREDFDALWPKQDFTKPPTSPVAPFIHGLADKGFLPIEKSLKILSDKSHLAFLPLEKYDIDYELMRKMPAETCLRWCVIPFDRMSKTLIVATANPFNRQAEFELEQASRQRLLWYLTSPQDILHALKKGFRN